MSVQVFSATKAGGVSLCVEIATVANPYEYAADSPVGEIGDGSRAVAWYLAAGYDRVGTRLFGTPKHATKAQITGKCSRVHHKKYTLAVSVPKRGASVTAAVKTICKELCSVPFEAFKNHAQLRGHAVPSRDEFTAAERAVADAVGGAKFTLVGKFRNAADEKKFKEYVTKGHAATESFRAHTGKAPAVSQEKHGLSKLTTAIIPAKGLTAFAICEYLETNNIPAKVRGDHVHVPLHTVSKIQGFASSADKKAKYKTVLEGSGTADAKKQAMAAFVFAASTSAFTPQTPPTPATLANEVFAALKRLA